MNTATDVPSTAAPSSELALAPTPRRLPFWLPPLFYLLLACLFLWRSTFAGDVFLPAGLLGHIAPWKEHVGMETLPPWNPLRWDGIGQFYPWRHFAAESVRTGTLPLWNPYQFCGTPFVANSQSAVFYPGNALFYLIPDTARAFGYSAVLHLTLCGWFTYLLLRLLRCSEIASLAGGLVFAYSAWEVNWLQLPTFLATSCWLPLLLHQVYGLRSLYVRSRTAEDATFVSRVPAVAASGQALRSLAGIGAVLGMMLLAGHLQIAFYGILASTLWMVGVLWRAGSEYGKAAVGRGLAIAIGGLAIGIAIASPQVLPSLELSRVSHRVGKPSAAGYSAYTEYALPSSQLAALTLPGLFGGDSQTENPYWGFYLKSLPTGPPVPVRHNAAETAVYVGIGTLALGLLALGRGLRKGSLDRRTVFFAVLALLALLLALGTPLNAFFYFLVPGFGQSGSPARCLVLWALAWAALAAFGLDRLRESRPSGRELLLVFGGIIGILALGLLLTMLSLMIVPSDTKWVPAFSEAMGRIGPDWARLLVCLAACAVLMGWKALNATIDPATGVVLRRERLALPALILMTIELFSAGIQTNPTAPRTAVYPTTEAIRYLQENLGHERMFPINQRWSLYTPPPVVLPPNSGMVYNLHDVQGYDSLFTGQYKSFANGFARPNIMGALDASPPEVGNMVFFQNARAENVGALGASIAVSLSPESAGYSPDSVPQTAPLPISDPSLNLIPFPPHPARAHLQTASTPDAVTWNEDSPTRVRLTVNATQSDTLALDDQFYPGWQATVDGKPVEIKRQAAASVFRAVDVPAGSHTVTFTYRPTAIRVGLFLACVALSLLTFVFVSASLTKRASAQ